MRRCWYFSHEHPTHQTSSSEVCTQNQSKQTIKQSINLKQSTKALILHTSTPNPDSTYQPYYFPSHSRFLPSPSNISSISTRMKTNIPATKPSDEGMYAGIRASERSIKQIKSSVSQNPDSNKTYLFSAFCLHLVPGPYLPLLHLPPSPPIHSPAHTVAISSSSTSTSTTPHHITRNENPHNLIIQTHTIMFLIYKVHTI